VQASWQDNVTIAVQVSWQDNVATAVQAYLPDIVTGVQVVWQDNDSTAMLAPHRRFSDLFLWRVIRKENKCKTSSEKGVSYKSKTETTHPTHNSIN
jgi:hypothetical protein